MCGTSRAALVRASRLHCSTLQGLHWIQCMIAHCQPTLPPLPIRPLFSAHANTIMTRLPHKYTPTFKYSANASSAIGVAAGVAACVSHNSLHIWLLANGILKSVSRLRSFVLYLCAAENCSQAPAPTRYLCCYVFGNRIGGGGRGECRPVWVHAFRQMSYAIVSRFPDTTLLRRAVTSHRMCFSECKRQH